jgi:hypothetical protein
LLNRDADGDMGYPGLLAARVQYSVQAGAVLVMRYNAQLFAEKGQRSVEVRVVGSSFVIFIVPSVSCELDQPRVLAFGGTSRAINRNAATLDQR